MSRMLESIEDPSFPFRRHTTTTNTCVPSLHRISARRRLLRPRLLILHPRQLPRQPISSRFQQIQFLLLS